MMWCWQAEPHSMNCISQNVFHNGQHSWPILSNTSNHAHTIYTHTHLSNRHCDNLNHPSSSIQNVHPSWTNVVSSNHHNNWSKSVKDRNEREKETNQVWHLNCSTIHRIVVHCSTTLFVYCVGVSYLMRHTVLAAKSDWIIQMLHECVTSNTSIAK